MTEEAKQTNKQQRPRQTAPRRPQIETRRPHRSIVTRIPIKSETVNSYMYRGVDRATGIIGNVAGLIQLTNKEPVIRERVNQWLEGELTEAKRRIELISKMKEVDLEEAGDILEGVQVDVPEQFTVTVRVTHPVFWRVIEILNSIDSEVAEYETLWIMGMLEEERFVAVKGIATNTIKRLIGRLEYVSTRSAGRKGGVFNDDDFKQIMNSITKASQNSEEQSVSEITPLPNKAEAEVEEEVETEMIPAQAVAEKG